MISFTAQTIIIYVFDWSGFIKGIFDAVLSNINQVICNYSSFCITVFVQLCVHHK